MKDYEKHEEENLIELNTQLRSYFELLDDINCMNKMDNIDDIKYYMKNKEELIRKKIDECTEKIVYLYFHKSEREQRLEKIKRIRMKKKLKEAIDKIKNKLK